MVRKHGVSLTTLFEWHEDTRTLSQYFWPSPGTGNLFALHFIFAENYQIIQRNRHTTSVHAPLRPPEEYTVQPSFADQQPFNFPCEPLPCSQNTRKEPSFPIAVLCYSWTYQ
ncbi:hypothetical protein RvY_03963-2 [Ramazzottius varieornatus]|uniref:Uncharacterized protein n=1 Tax=Ramazzottius varieornatus TaxID=947166 RepID=A0A1D1UWY0_RAMVA|nr:hypothetical protein RvY_03963-2 [Ramazzottius varieornatus]